ncbi:MAG: hypothetical protein AAF368_18410, partial [Planctomycetota bacterium]
RVDIVATDRVNILHSAFEGAFGTLSSPHLDTDEWLRCLETVHSQSKVMNTWKPINSKTSREQNLGGAIS